MEIISKRFCVTPRHDLGTCYNCSSIEINRIHDTLKLDRKEAFVARSAKSVCLNIVYHRHLLFKSAVDVAKERAQTLNLKSNNKKMENFMLR